MTLEKRGDGMKLTAEMADGGLDVRVETDPIPALSYTSETGAERITDSSTHLDVEQEPAAVGILNELKSVLVWITVIILLVTLFIIGINLWQRKKETT